VSESSVSVNGGREKPKGLLEMVKNGVESYFRRQVIFKKIETPYPRII